MDWPEVDARLAEIAATDDDDPWPSVTLVGLQNRLGVLPNFDHRVRVHVEGPLGNYAAAFMRRGEIRVQGDVGFGLAHLMTGGVIRVRGHAGNGVASCIQGGTVAVYGSAGHRVASMMRGGGIMVRGNVGDECGLGAVGGSIVIGGKAGHRLGLAAQDTTIFIRGSVASKAEGMVEAPLRKQSLLQLGMLLMNASIRGEAKDFRRIVPESVLRREEEGRGEVNPSWR